MDNHPTNRNDAVERGLSYYFTGKQCKRGNIAMRNLKAECQCHLCLAATRESKRKYANANPSTRIEWEAKNKDKVAAYKRIWQQNNHGKFKASIAVWKSKNKDKVAARNRFDQIKASGAVPVWYGELDDLVATEAYALANLRKKSTGIAWSVDHMIPLKAKIACGLHCADNLQVIPLVMNIKKQAQMRLTQPFEWLK